ncbi:wax ester/triacylglycerol synthase domain-containing protein [Actinopolymorpha alba]|uniref:wax ester/triacylglycerol synthase domain-containing protein n=1 Tax=Actinopolymorpha alba TaxID=533267 RepID=UPI00037737F5|nr:wax ester/triacylglycerol synthase domain-containing protein [Actinopolymorpha alba]
MIVSAQMGAGHDATGRALEEAFREHWPDSEVRWVDTLDTMGPGVGAAFRWIYVASVERVPWLYELFYTATWRYPWFARAAKRFTGSWSGRRLATEIDGFEPELILSTYPLGSAGLAWLRKHRGLAARTAAWVPDFAPHPFWVYSELDTTYVMHDTAVPLARVVDQTANVQVSALPVVQAFHPGSQASARRRLGLRPDAFVVLLSGGAFAFGIVESMMRAVLSADERIQVVTVCGRNQAALDRLERLGVGRDRLLPLGWVDDMPLLNQAADVVVTNAGGATALEALACGRPVFMAEPIAAHGAANANLMTVAGLAELFASKAQLTARMRAVVADAAPLRSLGRAARSHVARYDLSREVGGFAGPVPVLTQSLTPGLTPGLTRGSSEGSAPLSPAPRPWPVRSADAFFVHVEDGRAPQEVGAVLELDPLTDGRAETVSLRQVRELVTERMRYLPPLHRQLVRRGHQLGWAWQDHVDVDAHVVEHPGGAGSDAEMTAAVEGFWSRAMPRARPPWQMMLVRHRAGGPSILAVKVHHAMGDGISALGLLDGFLDADPGESGARDDGDSLASALPDTLGGAAFLRGLWQLSTRGRAPHHPLNHPVSAPVEPGRRSPQAPDPTTGRSVVLVPLPGKDFRRTAEQFDVRLHELALGVVAEGLERVLRPAGLLASRGPLRAMVPMTTPRRLDRIFGNWSGAVALDLAMGPMAPKVRLDRICAEVRHGVSNGEPLAASAVMRTTALLPAPAQAWFARHSYSDRYFNLVVSYLPGPRGPRRLAGVPVRAIYPVLPTAGNLPLAVGVITTEAVAAVGIVTDRSLGLDAGAVTASVQAAFQEFAEA